jgi:hypothetical protein
MAGKVCLHILGNEAGGRISRYCHDRHTNGDSEWMITILSRPARVMRHATWQFAIFTPEIPWQQN